ncbi:MAG: RhuM family protein [Gulosibacter sp.]|uniref:RhuM family protein n=1 Tax=Gulosibacter sp. TaxID=2817531 RepID=UPI003F8F8230
MTDLPHGEVVFYQSEDGSPGLEVRIDSDTVWLNQQQIAELFQTSRTNLVEHIRNVYEEGELDEVTTCRNFRQVRTEGSRQVARVMPFYNLDLIISVGYRVKSKMATQFRIWATEKLRKYVVDGVAVNESRLSQLGQAVQILTRAADHMLSGSAEVIARYLTTLKLLRDYDAGDLSAPSGTLPGWQLTYKEAREVINAVAREFPEDTLFGGERGELLRGVIDTVYQSFGGAELYPSTQEKAAHLLYFVVKDHPLTDGNKRSAAALFVTFLAKNQALMRNDQVPFISNNALAALTLMVSMSDPREKDLMIALIVNMLSEPYASN